MRHSADALLSIINDILDFSKIEAGRLTFEHVDFDLHEVVEDVLGLFAQRAGSKGLELLSWFPEEAPHRLRGDPGRLRQVLLNLLGNAVKFTETGEVMVSVECVESSPEEALLRFEIVDTGIGIPEQLQKSLFQPFSQADSTTTRRYGGTGLGLAICRQLVQMMNGEIGLESAPDRGSTFWFTARFERQTTPEAPALDYQAALKGCHVLVVDDNPTNRTILDRQLSSWGMHPYCATGANEALEVMRQPKPERPSFDLIVLDMQMPDMDGLTLAQTILRDPCLCPVPMVMLSSIGGLNDEILKASGICRCLTKPARLNDLRKALADAVASKDSFLSTSSTLRPKAPASQPTPPLRRSLRILLAEDNVINTKVTLGQLRQLGYAADAVVNGRQVLEALEKRHYDVILMDCQMPELDGYRTTRQIRSQEQLTGSMPHTPLRIVAMTANAMQGDRERCLEAGMDDYVSKPVRMDELKAALARSEESVVRAENDTHVDEVLDQHAISELRALADSASPGLLGEVIDLFISESPALIRDIENAAGKGDLNLVSALAQKLKGSSSNVGGKQLGQLMEKWRLAMREGRPMDPGQFVQDTQASYELLKEALSRLRAEDGVSLPQDPPSEG